MPTWTCGKCGHEASLKAFYRFAGEEWDYQCPSCGTMDNQHLRIPRIDLQEQGKVTHFYIPSPKQVLLHTARAKNVLWGGRAGTGKVLHPSTSLPTPSGFTTMGAVKVGDQVLDEHGRPCNVVWKSEPHVDPTGTFRMTFSDGTELITGGQHEWWTYTYRERVRYRANTPEYQAKRRAKRASRAKPHDGTNQKPWTTAVLLKRNAEMSAQHVFVPVNGGIRTTQAVAETLTARRGLQLNHAVPVSGVWEMDEQALPVDPYVLGAWLGDGTSSGGSITGLDDEVFRHVAEAGYEVRHYANPRTRGVHGLYSQLRQLGVAPVKNIPAQYLGASASQRLALLQGLMDTDGYCGKGGTVEFCNTNRNLAEGVLHLARSFGIAAVMSEGRATLYGKDCGPKYRVTWTSTLQVFRLQRKVDRLPKKVRETQRYRYITKVERIADEEMQCIQVDSPSHLYLCTEAGIPTHNSHGLRMDAYQRCLTVPGYRVLLLRRNFSELRDTHLDKAAYEAERIGARWRAADYTIVFSNGSRLRFGHCENDTSVSIYLSSEFDCIMYDEGSTFTEYAVRFINSRLRTAKKGVIPCVRIGSNPGAMWLYRYYISKDITAEEDPGYKTEDYDFIPTDLTDNPHINLEEQQARIMALPSEALRKMYGDGDWLAVEGQFFTDWTPKDREKGRPWHVINELPTIDGKPVDQIDWIERVRALDWGYSPDPGVCLWVLCLPGGRYIVVKEFTFRELIAKKAAEAIKHETGKFKVRYTVAGHDCWMSSKDSGESISETFGKNGVPLRLADTNRVNGWQRVHAMLQETSNDGTGAVPSLQIYGPGCPALVRTLPMLRDDPRTPGDVTQESDHWADALRYFAMSRPSGSRVKKTDVWARLPKEIQRALRSSGHQPLGTENVMRRVS